MKECLRLSQDGKTQSIERIVHKASKLGEDTNGQSDTEEQLPTHEVYDAPLIGAKKKNTSKRMTRSVTRLRSRNYYAIGRGIPRFGGRHGQAEERTTRFELA